MNDKEKDDVFAQGCLCGVVIVLLIEVLILVGYLVGRA